MYGFRVPMMITRLSMEVKEKRKAVDDIFDMAIAKEKRKRTKRSHQPVVVPPPPLSAHGTVFVDWVLELKRKKLKEAALLKVPL